MSVKLTSEAERERVANRARPTWELLRTLSIVEAVHFARDNGWGENKVQVKAEHKASDVIEFVVEPYEGCNCPALLHYEDYYGTED